MYKEIYRVVQENPKDNFHYVLIELALLNSRKPNPDTWEDELNSVIHVLVNGEFGDYKDLPFGNDKTKLVAKINISGVTDRDTFDYIRNEHEFFFKVLRAISLPDYF